MLFNVEIRVEWQVPRDQLCPEDRERGPVGEYWIELAADDPQTAEDLGLEWFNDHYAPVEPENYRISPVVHRLRP
jgi:hypothetical protein